MTKNVQELNLITELRGPWRRVAGLTIRPDTFERDGELLLCAWNLEEKGLVTVKLLRDSWFDKVNREFSRLDFGMIALVYGLENASYILNRYDPKYKIRITRRGLHNDP